MMSSARLERLSAPLRMAISRRPASVFSNRADNTCMAAPPIFPRRSAQHRARCLQNRETATLPHQPAERQTLALRQVSANPNTLPRSGADNTRYCLRLLPALPCAVTGTKIASQASGKRHANSPRREPQLHITTETPCPPNLHADCAASFGSTIRATKT
jgi:hypothetical protein